MGDILATKLVSLRKEFLYVFSQHLKKGIPVRQALENIRRKLVRLQMICRSKQVNLLAGMFNIRSVAWNKPKGSKYCKMNKLIKRTWFMGED